MDFNPKLYVEIHPFEGEHQPHPHPIRDGRFSMDYVYKVLGVYNPSETSECYFMLVNPERQVWFIPQRHLLAYRLIDSDEFFLTKSRFETATRAVPRSEGVSRGEGVPPSRSPR